MNCKTLIHSTYGTEAYSANVPHTRSPASITTKFDHYFLSGYIRALMFQTFIFSNLLWQPLPFVVGVAAAVVGDPKGTRQRSCWTGSACFPLHAKGARSVRIFPAGYLCFCSQLHHRLTVLQSLFLFLFPSRPGMLPFNDHLLHNFSLVGAFFSWLVNLCALPVQLILLYSLQF